MTKKMDLPFKQNAWSGWAICPSRCAFDQLAYMYTLFCTLVWREFPYPAHE